MQASEFWGSSSPSGCASARATRWMVGQLPALHVDGGRAVRWRHHHKLCAPELCSLPLCMARRSSPPHQMQNGGQDLAKQEESLSFTGVNGNMQGYKTPCPAGSTPHMPSAHFQNTRRETGRVCTASSSATREQRGAPGSSDLGMKHPSISDSSVIH